MKLFQTLAILITALSLSWATARAEDGRGDHDRGDQDQTDDHAEQVKGPNGGILLRRGDTTVELAIYERGVPPEYRAWISRDGEAITDSAELRVELLRLGGQKDTFPFAFQGAYWLGDGIVAEPHSFDVTVTLNLQGKRYRWQWESHEGRTEIDRRLAEEAGIRTRVAAAGQVTQTIQVHGRLVADPDRLTRVTGRFPGLIKQVSVNLGDAVKAGDTLAIIESNDSLQSYRLSAPISGTVIRRNVNIGELADDQPLFVIADLSRLWAELKIFPEQQKAVRVGQVANLGLDDRQYRAELMHLLPAADNAPYVIARSIIDNSDARLAPGRLVSAEVVIDSAELPLVVEKRALQSFRDWSVVFIQVGDTYEIRPLELGRGDRHVVEVLSGLSPGDHYVVENSYLLKADIEKSGASHDH